MKFCLLRLLTLLRKASYFTFEHQKTVGTKSTVGIVAEITGKGSLKDRTGDESRPYLVVASSFKRERAPKNGLPAIAIRNLVESDATLVFSYKTEFLVRKKLESRIWVNYLS